MMGFAAGESSFDDTFTFYRFNFFILVTSTVRNTCAPQMKKQGIRSKQKVFKVAIFSPNRLFAFQFSEKKGLQNKVTNRKKTVPKEVLLFVQFFLQNTLQQLARSTKFFNLCTLYIKLKRKSCIFKLW